ncbi:hypothetical protein HNQ59_001724 [Chitinivorax tropicus]|uniref:Uncharacterized protein n=1 Tax=Chitinivorax tropicus TaxID=714531 RepID=A0A840MLS4_9PROT|nr:hypothetical protein [Chitinivorax tropicus]MBB5018435.1 hypothetical protein [Chitinivorax tropicus]
MRLLNQLVCMAVLGWSSICAVKAEPLSREFKLPLLLAPFQAENLDRSIQEYARQFVLATEVELAAQTRGKVKKGKRRAIQFLDVPGQCTLQQAGYILRERWDAKRRVMTLKTRSADQTRVNQLHLGDGSAKGKLEEDISPPLDIKLSRSASINVDRTPGSVEEAAGMFSILKTLPGDAKLQAVNGLHIQEHTYTLPSIDLGGAWAEAGVTLWYEPDSQLRFAEMSFRYDTPADPTLAKRVATRAEQLFTALQRGEWAADGVTQTKTEWVYRSGDSPFCR